MGRGGHGRDADFVDGESAARKNWIAVVGYVDQIMYVTQACESSGKKIEAGSDSLAVDALLSNGVK